MAFLGGLPSRSYKSHQAVTGYMSALYTLQHPHTWAFFIVLKLSAPPRQSGLWASILVCLSDCPEETQAV